MQTGPVVCVVDDDEYVRITLCAALSYAGFATVPAKDGAAALDAIARSNAAIAIVDLIMPGKEGVETIMEAKARFPNLKIVAITGGGSIGANDLLSLAREVGADEVMAKPIRNADLVTAVVRLWDETRGTGDVQGAAGG